MTIAELSIKRPVTAIMFFVSLFVIGLIAAIRLPLEAFPEVSPPFIFVQIPYTGSTPEEVERTVLRPVEEAMSTMSGIKRIDSEAKADGATVFMQFTDWERDVAIAASEARERIDAIREDLPDDLQRYNVLKFSTTDQPVLRVRLASESQNLVSAYDLIEREFKRRLERIPGVARVEISGAPPNEVEIAIEPDRLTAHNLGLDPLAWLDALPAHCVGELHLAGHRANDADGRTVLIDDHGARVDRAVWALYAHALGRFGRQPTLVEWDSDVPALEVLVDEARAADTVAARRPGGLRAVAT